MGDDQRVVGDDLVAEKQEIEVDGARLPFFVSSSAHFTLDFQ